ncbi:MAG: hypothetical protein ABW135_17045 [Thermoleophilaceae bacterium]
MPATIGAAALAGAVVESWSVALAVGGVVTAWWAYLLERRSRESGGDARRAAKELIGPIDLLAKRRALRELDQGVVARPGELVLGIGSRGRPVSLRFGGTSGRHGLLLGASGSGKSNALLWCLARHIDARFGAVVVDMRATSCSPGDSNARQTRRASCSTNGRSTAGIGGTRSRGETAANSKTS